MWKIRRSQDRHISLTWESPYLGKTAFILRWGPGGDKQHNTPPQRYATNHPSQPCRQPGRQYGRQSRNKCPRCNEDIYYGTDDHTMCTGQLDKMHALLSVHSVVKVVKQVILTLRRGVKFLLRSRPTGNHHAVVINMSMRLMLILRSLQTVSLKVPFIWVQFLMTLLITTLVPVSPLGNSLLIAFKLLVSVVLPLVHMWEFSRLNRITV